MQAEKDNIILFLVISTLVIILLATLVVSIIFIFQKARAGLLEKLKSLKFEYEKNILAARLEMKEKTFLEISREIHDNINLGLSLAKLNLNTFDWTNKEKGCQQLALSIDILGQTITNLSDISKSLNSDIIKNQGLAKAVEQEISKIQLTGLFQIHFHLTGVPVFMDNTKELIILRIIQESINNIIKHAKANTLSIIMHYSINYLYININDNGCGFLISDNISNSYRDGKSGLHNMQARIKMISGTMNINSVLGLGTSLKFYIPYI